MTKSEPLGSTERERLVEKAAEAMRKNNRIPEMAVLSILPDAQLRAIIAAQSGPLFVA